MERLTDLRKLFVHQLLTTPTLIHLRWRTFEPSGEVNFEKVERFIPRIAFSRDEREFVTRDHQNNPRKPLSPFYINLRNPSPELMTLLINVLAQVRLIQQPDYCTGVPDSGVPIALAYAKKTKIGYADVLEKFGSKKVRGVTYKKDGFPLMGAERNLLIIDDVINNAISATEVVKAAEYLGWKVSGFLAVFQRGIKGANRLRSQGYNLDAAIDFAQVLEYGYPQGLISQEDFEKSAKYLAR